VATDGHKYCPDPAAAADSSVTAFTDLQDVNHNGKNNFYNLYYANQAGILHVVSVYGTTNNLIMQASAYRHVHVAFASRKANTDGGRVNDAIIYGRNIANFEATRFFVSTTACEDQDKVPSAAVKLFGNTSMFTRVLDTGSTNGAQATGIDVDSFRRRNV
jgi:hypothetical protein